VVAVAAVEEVAVEAQHRLHEKDQQQRQQKQPNWSYEQARDVQQSPSSLKSTKLNMTENFPVFPISGQQMISRPPRTCALKSA
jgi:hypothetical protein